MKILLIGPQGSGKSTQGKILSQYLNIPYTSSGDIFREIASSETEQSKAIKQILDKGQLVDDQTVINLIRERIGRQDCVAGFILDGTPRTFEQAKALEDIKLDKVIYFNAPRELVLSRLLKRGREDDKEELINKRLDLFFEQTQPLLEYYKQQGILVEIDATATVEEIQQKIRDGING